MTRAHVVKQQVEVVKASCALQASRWYWDLNPSPLLLTPSTLLCLTFIISSTNQQTNLTKCCPCSGSFLEPAHLLIHYVTKHTEGCLKKWDQRQVMTEINAFSPKVIWGPLDSSEPRHSLITLEGELHCTHSNHRNNGYSNYIIPWFLIVSGAKKGQA